MMEEKKRTRTSPAGGLALTVVSALGVTSCGTAGDGESIDFIEQPAVSPITVSFQNGALPTSSYSGTVDSTIRQASASTNYGSSSTCEADGDDGNGVDKSCLIRWQLTGIPAGSTVQSARITLRVVDSSSNTYALYGVLRAWNQPQVTWQNAANGSPWATAGALAATDRGPTIGSVTGSGTKTIQLNASGVALVQSWVNGATNGGIVVASTSNTDGIDFLSSEGSPASQRPRLDITYLPPDPGGGGSGGAGGAGAGGSGTAGSGTAGSGGVAGASSGISTDPNLKIGFIGDTHTGTNFRKVLNLVKNEGAQAVVVQGDMSYSANPNTWWSDVESVLGTSFPIFLSRGNHDDSSWSGYLTKANQHLGGATRVSGAHDANYKTTFRGLVIATIRRGDGASRINSLLQGDNHVWKVCQWHENQQAMQVGGKGDEMGWEVYEACRAQGAIVQTGHEHSYSRTKTLTSISSRIVDSSCSGAASLCVGPGRTFVTVSGLGGHSVRAQTRCLPSTPPYGCNGEWGSIYTSNQNATYGAQFIVFNAGAPKVATGYFKDIEGDTIDVFSITHD